MEIYQQNIITVKLLQVIIYVSQITMSITESITSAITDNTADVKAIEVHYLHQMEQGSLVPIPYISS